MAVRKTKKGLALKRWFKEDWKDVKTGKACGRKKGDGRGTPYCRPTKRVSSKTPKTSGEMTAAQKKSRIAQKKRLGQRKSTRLNSSHGYISYAVFCLKKKKKNETTWYPYEVKTRSLQNRSRVNATTTDTDSLHT